MRACRAGPARACSVPPGQYSPHATPFSTFPQAVLRIPAPEQDLMLPLAEPLVPLLPYHGPVGDANPNIELAPNATATVNPPALGAAQLPVSPMPLEPPPGLSTALPMRLSAPDSCPKNVVGR